MGIERTQPQADEVRLTWTDQLVEHEAKGSPESIKSVWDALIAANRTYQYPRYTRIRGRMAEGGGTADGLGLEDVRRLSLQGGDADVRSAS